MKSQNETNKSTQKPLLKVLFSVDDVHPEIGFGLYKDRDNLKYLLELNKEFGVKFTLFMVPCWENHEEYNLTKYRSWIEWIYQQKCFEIAAHGYSHKADDEKYRHLEFVTFSEEQARERLKKIKEIFNQCGINVQGWKTPGWLHNKEIYKALPVAGFSWIADHVFGEEPIVLSNGLVQVPYNCSTEELEFACPKNVAIIHSHINPANCNENGWSELRYLQTKQFLLDLQKKYELVPMTFTEYVFKYMREEYGKSTN